jgi:hypothetical protein
MKNNWDEFFEDLKLRILILIFVLGCYFIFSLFFCLICKKSETIVNLQPVSGVAQPLKGAENK